MANVIKQYIIAEMRNKFKNIEEMVPKAVYSHVKEKYKCSSYMAKEITKELTKQE